MSRSGQTMHMQLGECVRTARHYRGLSQSELAAATGRPPNSSTVSGIENGVVHGGYVNGEPGDSRRPRVHGVGSGWLADISTALSVIFYVRPGGIWGWTPIEYEQEQGQNE